MKLFQTPPVSFKPRKGNKLDEKIYELLIQLDVKIPIVLIKENLYLIGTSRVICDLRNESVIVRVGGGNDTLFNYLANNHKQFERQLAVQMLKNKQTLHEILYGLSADKKLKNLVGLLMPRTPSPTKSRSPSPNKWAQIPARNEKGISLYRK